MVRAECERLKRMADASHIGLAQTDEDDNIIYANQRMMRMPDLPSILRDRLMYDLGTRKVCGLRALLQVLQDHLDTDVEFQFERDGERKTFVGRAGAMSMPDELGRVETMFQFTDISERARREARDRYYANHDALTGAYNRAAFTADLDRVLHDVEAGRMCALLALDLDRFKPVNDRHGHLVGDRVLRGTVARVQAEAEERYAVVYRLGGDEFVVLYLARTDEEVIALAERIVSTVHEPHEIGNLTLSIGTSVGISICPDDTDCPKMLLDLADAALYCAKARGGNQVCLYGDVKDTLPKRPDTNPTDEADRAAADGEADIEDAEFELRANDTPAERLLAARRKGRADGSGPGAVAARKRLAAEAELHEMRPV